MTGPEGGFAYGPWSSLPGFWVVGFPVGRRYSWAPTHRGAEGGRDAR